MRAHRLTPARTPTLGIASPIACDDAVTRPRRDCGPGRPVARAATGGPDGIRRRPAGAARSLTAMCDAGGRDGDRIRRWRPRGYTRAFEPPPLHDVPRRPDAHGRAGFVAKQSRHDAIPSGLAGRGPAARSGSRGAPAERASRPSIDTMHGPGPPVEAGVAVSALGRHARRRWRATCRADPRGSTSRMPPGCGRGSTPRTGPARLGAAPLGRPLVVPAGLTTARDSERCHCGSKRMGATFSSVTELPGSAARPPVRRLREAESRRRHRRRRAPQCRPSRRRALRRGGGRRGRPGRAGRRGDLRVRRSWRASGCSVARSRRR